MAEDEPSIGEVVSLYLKRAGYAVSVVREPGEAAVGSLAQRQLPDLVGARSDAAEGGRPGESPAGCAATVDTPIIMLTAQRGGVRPHRRPGDGRGRLCGEAVQPTGAGRPACAAVLRRAQGRPGPPENRR